MKIFGLEIKKAPKVKTDETYGRAVFHYLSNNQILWMPNDAESYVKDAFYVNPDVYNAVMTIVKMASRAPLNLYKVKNAKAAKRYKAMTKGLVDSSSLRDVARTKALAFDEVGDHPVLDLLANPNEWQSEADFRGNRLGFQLVTGNYYVYKSIPTLGTKTAPVALYILPSQYMQIVSGGLMEPVKAYVNTYNNLKEQIEAERIIHNRTWSLDYSYAGSHLFGVSPLKAASKAVTMNNYGREAHVKTLQNGGVKGLLELSEMTDGLTPEQETALKDKFREMGGTENRGVPAITNQKVQWHEMGLDAVEMSIMEALKASGQDIYKVFGIDLNMYSTDASSYNNKKEAIKHTLFMAVIPLLISDRDSLNHGLLPHFEDNTNYFLDYDLTVYSELNENRKELADTLDKMPFLSLNEKRIEAGYDTVADENMDKFYLSSSVEPLDKINTEMDLPNIPNNGDFE